MSTSVLSVCLSVTSRYCIETAALVELVFDRQAFLDAVVTILRKFWHLDLEKFSHGT